MATLGNYFELNLEFLNGRRDVGSAPEEPYKGNSFSFENNPNPNFSFIYYSN